MTISLPISDKRTREERAAARLAPHIEDHIRIVARPEEEADPFFWRGTWTVSYRGQTYTIEVRVPTHPTDAQGHVRRVRRAAAREIAILEIRAGRTEPPE